MFESECSWTGLVFPLEVQRRKSLLKRVSLLLVFGIVCVLDCCRSIAQEFEVAGGGLERPIGAGDVRPHPSWPECHSRGVSEHKQRLGCQNRLEGTVMTWSY